ncbi:MAG: coenzyme F420-0:L-glutamate ligase [Candidatus Lokiarchaeota archaeon]|nr:coenzyme F420-0:L-glutamate ligase [Candidatus Lokiarchaeota archaeon]
MSRGEDNQQGIEVISVQNYPLTTETNSIEDNIMCALADSDIRLEDGDILVIAHKIVSKSEGRVIDGKSIKVTPQAIEIAKRNDFDPVQVELAIQESKEILRDERVLITITKTGLICNFSGVDKSNVQKGHYVLLPEDPDKSARRILETISEATGKKIAVVITDTQGRPWRRGGVNIAIGCAGIDVFKYNIGKRDLYGRKLERSTICQIDEIASAAEPMMGQGAEGTPIVLVRGYVFTANHDESSLDIFRTDDEDLFR